MDDLRSSASFIIKSMEDKSLLITGSTGFLGKVFMEEVLRIQPRVKKLYLLLRAQDTKSATKRFHQQVLEKEVFNVLREEHGEGFNSFISSKVVPLAGDISLKNLGIKDFKLEQEMFKEIDFIVNVAANTNWDDRYDMALSINTLGAKHVCEFAKKCQKLELLLHVSSAYAGMRIKEGLILEKPFRMKDILNENSKTLSIELELKIAQERLKQLRELEEVTEKNVTDSMKELGMQRAKFHGWPNTYVFTKAMGEMLLGQLREKSVPLVIIRCTLITSTWKRPFPGWIEGFKGIDALVQNYGKGELTHSVADPDSIMDVIPGDMVVNAMMVAMAAHSRFTIRLQPHLTPLQDQEQVFIYHVGSSSRNPIKYSHLTPLQDQEQVFIYHVGSSSRNPIKYSHLTNWAYDYFTKNPHLGANGKPIQVPRWTILPTMESFSKYATLNYKLPLEALRVVKDSSYNKSFEDLYNKLNRQYTFLTRLSQLFEPLVLYRGVFDSSNLVKLGTTMKEAEDIFGGHTPRVLGFGNSIVEAVGASSTEEVVKSCFDIDPKNIDWENYFMNVHFPGSTKYAFNSNRPRVITKSRL